MIINKQYKNKRFRPLRLYPLVVGILLYLKRSWGESRTDLRLVTKTFTLSTSSHSVSLLPVAPCPVSLLPVAPCHYFQLPRSEVTRSPVGIRFGKRWDRPVRRWRRRDDRYTNVVIRETRVRNLVLTSLSNVVFTHSGSSWFLNPSLYRYFVPLQNVDRYPRPPHL